MLKKEEKYRGLLIDTNIDGKFLSQPTYYTVVNPFIENSNGNPHVHCRHKKDTKKVVDCFHTIRKGEWYAINKYKPNLRNLAMILLGYNYKSKTN
jgi:hypothetical protein